MGFKNLYKHHSELYNCYLQGDEPLARFCRVVNVEKPVTIQRKICFKMS